MSEEVSETRIITTLGELVEALTQIALENCKTKKEGYLVASEALSELLSQSNFYESALKDNLLEELH
ncbi:MAG: hypothetical protein D6719_01770 [Candidatus Dadabacteria bacterium]|nr:MAG: hypothetical protein D6719_01770 [Candidatus Dadabacteria bacterium]